MIPPIGEDINYVVMAREPRSPVVTAILPNQDSYELTHEEAQRYLILLGVKETNHFLDYVWNFYGGRIGIPEGDLTPLSLTEACSYMKPSKQQVAF